MHRTTVRIFCFAALVLVATTAGATRMLPLSVDDMAVGADAIAIGRCVSGHSEWIGGTLMTLIEIDIEESLKGPSAQKLTLVVPGGVDADRPVPVAVTFPGAPVLFDGEDVLLFLAHSSAVAGGYQIIGFAQGKYSVVEDASGERLVAQDRYTGLNGIPLDDMKNQIQNALSGN